MDDNNKLYKYLFNKLIAHDIALKVSQTITWEQFIEYNETRLKQVIDEQFKAELKQINKIKLVLSHRLYHRKSFVSNSIECCTNNKLSNYSQQFYQRRSQQNV